MGAWLVVRPRVESSKDASTRAAAADFAKNPQRNIARLQRAIRAGSFIFGSQRGVLKRKATAPNEPKKEPRPIVVAPVLNRIVQRAVLDTCQSEDRRIRRRLGGLPAIVDCPTSVGGLPGRGVPEAMDLITQAVSEGATWFVRSDLKDFFQKIPKPKIEKFLRSNLRDEEFVDLFLKALATELSNEAEIRELIRLFPIGEIGVPQGSALSALCANIVLSDFDKLMNQRGIRTVRYLDDFVILGPNKRAVDKAWLAAVEHLKALGLECHDPAQGTGKAARGQIEHGFEFLSFRVTLEHVIPTKKACQDFIDDLKSTIRESKLKIASSEKGLRRAEPRFVQSLALLDRKIRGWGDAFQKATLRLTFSQLDSRIDLLIEDYLRWFGRVRAGKSYQHHRRMLGIALLGDTPSDEDSRSEVPSSQSKKAA
jgi:hypothetical protein